MPTVDIVVAVYGGLKHLERLVPALKATLPAEGVRVWFVDDVTPKEKGAKSITDFLTQVCADSPGWEYLMNTRNGGYAFTNNVGARQGTGEFVLLLNSDTEPQPGWLEAMLGVMALPQVGVVGAKLLFPEWSKDPDRPAGKIQHAGVVFDTGRMPYHPFLGWNPDHPKVNRPLKMQAVTGACLMIRRSLWERVGGLDEEFRQGNFEDVDLCLKVGELGYDVAYCPTAVLWHWGSGSNNTADVDRNAMIFASRWMKKATADDWMYW